MATLSALFGQLTLGKHNLQVSVLLGWKTVGTCNVTANSPFEFAATGTYNVLGRSGPFDIALKLTDQNPGAAAGPCTITNAGQSLDGTYTMDGASVTFSDGQHSVVASSDAGGVVLAISGYPKARIV
jgi:hypothetical protein